ncbi:MAG: glycosyltransferase [Phycisphaerae bacterium]|nr:glycosyltransferase [Phycisphaerae bacterium]
MPAPRVLMLGWEFPPFITGGLGTACYGLTKALDTEGVPVTFVLPKSVDRSFASHVNLLAPEDGARFVRHDHARSQQVATPSTPAPKPHDATVAPTVEPTVVDQNRLREFIQARLLELPVIVDAPYEGSRTEAVARWIHEMGAAPEVLRTLRIPVAGGATIPLADFLAPNTPAPAPAEAAPIVGAADYSGDLVAQSERYAQFCVQSARGLDFDVIHAHDWLTYPAGIAVARLTGKPLVVHVHATEFDRSGEHVNQVVYNIERRGMHAAARVLAVSMLTKNLCTNRYGVPAEKIDVVYNGVDLDPAQAGIKRIERHEKIVLYFGRITMQKGPEFFVRAAKRVLEVMGDVRFVVAGSGDQAQRMIELAAQLGIGGKMTFTGFLRGRDISRVFSMADLYVMPSVSEPFGIAPLEAMGHRVPVIISRNSGVSEILMHALKVDFWDVDDIANKIVAVLRHPPLQRALQDHGEFEVRGIGWDGAARKCVDSYRRAITTVRPMIKASSHP